MKLEVDRHVRELLDLRTIRPSPSEMASPTVCVLKCPRSENGVTFAVDFRLVKQFLQGDAFPTPDANGANVMVTPGVENTANVAHLVLNTLNLKIHHQSTGLRGLKTGLSVSGTASPVVWVLWDPAVTRGPNSRPAKLFGVVRFPTLCALHLC